VYKNPISLTTLFSLPLRSRVARLIKDDEGTDLGRYVYNYRIVKCEWKSLKGNITEPPVAGLPAMAEWRRWLKVNVRLRKRPLILETGDYDLTLFLFHNASPSSTIK